MTPSPLTPERLLDLARVNGVALSPDGRWLAVSVARLDANRAKYVSDLWRVSLDAGTAPVRLTRGDDNHRAPCFRNDGALGFLSNRNPRVGPAEAGDEERAQVWLFPTAGGDPIPLTDEPHGVSAFRFARDGDVLLVVADVIANVPHEKQRAHAAEQQKHGPTGLHYTGGLVRYWDSWITPASPHLIAYDARGGARRDLTPDARSEYREIEWDLSPDGLHLVATAQERGPDRIPDVALRLIDTHNASSRVLARATMAAFTTPRFTPDARAVVCMRETRPDDALVRTELVHVATDTGAIRVLGGEWDAQPRLAGFTPDGRTVVFTADHRGTVPVFALDVRTGHHVRVTHTDAGGSHESLVLAPDGTVVYGLRHRLTHPPEPFRVALTEGAEPTLLASLSGFGLDEAQRAARFSSREIVSTDGTPVQYFLAEPVAPTEGKRAAIVWIHGGPRAHWADGWQWRWNAITAAAQGYVVALPNPRGSTGFGVAFGEAIGPNRWGEQCYHDVLAVADALAAHDDVDPARMAAMGGSFGGYMTNWIGANTDRFRCLITHASLYFLSGFHGTTDEPGWWPREMGASPYTDPAAFDRYSPHRLVSRWKTPTLVIHGERDYRVPIGEALSLFEALQVHGVESEMLIFPDEGHWILRPRNSRQWLETVYDFLARHLRR